MVDQVTTFFKKYGLLCAALISALFLTFATGITIGILRLQPSQFVAGVIDETKDLIKNGRAYFLNIPDGHIMPREHAGNGVVISDPDNMQPGVTFVTGLFGDKLGFRLYGADGAFLYEWPISFFDIAPEQMRYPSHALIHGAHLYENGDVVANLDGRGAVRLNACGEIIWKNSDKSHHSIFSDADGSLWAPIHTGWLTDLRFSMREFKMDRIAKFDPENGEKQTEISLLDVLLQEDGFGRVQIPLLSDVLHVNDVEILDESMADAFPQFDAGDIMISSRHLNQIWVIDGDDHVLKWSFNGPFVGQHDPDFQPDGTITVLDNRPNRGLDAVPDLALGDAGSRILKINPVTGRNWSVYQTSDSSSFYTRYRGKHQVLANGNILIAETDRGRAYEVTPDGTVVWSFVNGWDKDNVGWVLGATKYPQRFGNFLKTKCD